MMINKYIISALLAITGASALAEGDEYGTGLFLEPGISYQVANSNVDYPGASNSSASTNGFGILLRGGVHVMDRFFVAADGRYGLLRFNDNSNNIDVRAPSWDVAPVIGMQMPENGPRIYVGYVLGGSLDPQETGGKNAQFNGATGWRLGAGLKMQHVSVNVEWQRLHFSNNKLTTSTASTTGVAYDPEGLIASITFPIEFR